MTLNGPYNSPLVLGVRPWGCLFFSFWAIFLIIPCVQGLMMLAAPEFTEAAILGETIEGLRARWTIILCGYVVTLFLTMSWAEYIGAGPFAASMKTERIWLLIGLVGAPLVLNLSGFVVEAIFSGDDPNWYLQDSANADALSPAATAGFGFVFAVVVLVPISEEIAYRGIGLGCLLSRGWDAYGSTFIVTLLFTLTHLHLTPAALIPVFLVGLFLSWLRIASGSLAPCIVAHIATNAATLYL